MLLLAIRFKLRVEEFKITSNDLGRVWDDAEEASLPTLGPRAGVM